MKRLTPRPETGGPSSPLTERIGSRALALGFDKVGFSRAEPLGPRSGLEKWLEAGHQGEMHWMSRNAAKRQDPSLILAEVRTVLSVAVNYHHPLDHSENPRHGKISRYAWGLDYHRLLKARLKNLAGWIAENLPPANGLFYSDTGPVMDKVWAHRSGLGWIGKHSNLVTRDLGSWLFLGEILLDLELPETRESGNFCGSCRRCLDACPTGAIVAPYVVDSRLCISYLTIELRGPVPLELRPLIGTRIFGCDDCQDVCPWNRFAQPSREKDFYPAPGNQAPVLMELMQISRQEFHQRFRLSPIRRCGYAGFLRNVAIALGNSGLPEAVPSLKTALHHTETLVRRHAAWALGRIGDREARSELLQATRTESDPCVRSEIRLALDSLQFRHSRQAAGPRAAVV